MRLFFQNTVLNRKNRWLELHDKSAVDLAASQIVGDGPLAIGNISDPVVAVDIADTEKVEAVDAKPDSLYN